MKLLKLSPILLLCLFAFLTSCTSHPEITHIVVKSNSLGTLLDSKDSIILSTIQKLFNDKQEQPNAGPTFIYLVDITIGGVTTRWQYSIDGYIRNYEETKSMIYLLKDVAEFNRTVNIR